MTIAAGHCPKPIEGHAGRSVGIAGQHKLLELDWLSSGITGHRTSGLNLIGSGNSYSFLSEQIALSSGLCIDYSCSLNINLVDRKKICQPRPGTWFTGYVCPCCSVSGGLLGCTLGYGCYSRCPLA